MDKVVHNSHLGDDVFLLKARLEEVDGVPTPGQFYMIRSWDYDPLLSRPLSVFDYDPEYQLVSFLYKRIGRGTNLLSRLAPGSDLCIEGPYGKGFKDIDTNLTLIGGGIGIAPLYYLGKMFKKKHPSKKLRAYLGFSKNVFSLGYFHKICDDLTIDIGGIITDRVHVFPGETVMCCGPEVMMDQVSRIVPANVDVYLSLESRMACGLGACLGCVREAPLIYRQVSEYYNEPVFVSNRQVKVCTDGPVFKREVIR